MTPNAAPGSSSVSAVGYEPGTAAPAKKWVPPVGYVPDRLKGQAGLDPLSAAPAKKWEPYGGYTPRREWVVDCSVPSAVVSAGAESEKLFRELSRLSQGCVKHMEQLTQAIYSSPHPEQASMQDLTSTYLQSCRTYKDKLSEMQSTLSEAAALRAQEVASTEGLTSSHVAVQAQVDMHRF